MRTVSSDKRYIEAWEKLQQLRQMYTDVDRQIDDAHTSLGQSDHDPIEAEAQALVEGKAIKRGEALPDLEGLYRKRMVLHLACQKQERVLIEVRDDVSREIVNEVWNDYTALVQNQHDAALALAKACEAEEAFIRTLTDGNTILGKLQRSTFHFDSEKVENFAKRAKADGLAIKGVK